MKTICIIVIEILSILLLSGPIASAANGDITLTGQFEGAYAKKIYTALLILMDRKSLL